MLSNEQLYAVARFTRSTRSTRFDFRETAKLAMLKNRRRYRPSTGFVKALGLLLPMLAFAWIVS